MKKGVKKRKPSKTTLIIIVMLIFIIGIAVVFIPPIEPSQTIKIGDFKCTGHNIEDKENCVELAQFKLISKILKDKNISEILREIDKLD